MKLITYQTRNLQTRLGALVDGYAVDIERLGAAAGVGLPDNMLDFIDASPVALQRTRELLDRHAGKWPLNVATPVANVRLLAPIPRPRKNIFGIGLNYVEHVAESARNLDTAKDLPKQPVVFSKPPTAVIGPGDAIGHNAQVTQQLDWEVELAVVIGSTCRRTGQEEAMDKVFGYTVLNDISARDCRRAGQWIFSKGQDTYAPMGPCIVTADEVPDPHNLNLWLKVNGQVKQNSNTRHLLFKIPALIADISSAITLEPGDIIATGTPAGVGAGMDPQEWLWPGDVVELGVESIGELRNPVVAV
ncbi:fumarylacetoacetate hydrolase family protein [Pseudoduganella namucuonensis]|uniref:2-keto-4-pentenoate hydratase/2-oxohepta-3-ene-1,7-dioic acid hydratase (Catechol pathway) n=1 Tax=Pseudoduganella namucuonensis TaxID=1035707 RepID=A0A1I7LH36_9BURK|nr:fumarylacetoacetate hydrolase family protein [Pseudoduganella namucuonensis]SFV08991.1 2-keto-4-pentenoate hydratase/2-oxohepta-3-ene-1,7-dioic acid hydratase (catechol pathway) [Pseudoduganella namucuonensis]